MTGIETTLEWVCRDEIHELVIPSSSASLKIQVFLPFADSEKYYVKCSGIGLSTEAQSDLSSSKRWAVMLVRSLLEEMYEAVEDRLGCPECGSDDIAVKGMTRVRCESCGHVAHAARFVVTSVV